MHFIGFRQSLHEYEEVVLQLWGAVPGKSLVNEPWLADVIIVNALDNGIDVDAHEALMESEVHFASVKLEHVVEQR